MCGMAHGSPIPKSRRMGRPAAVTAPPPVPPPTVISNRRGEIATCVDLFEN
jgi:hypothetical protein